MDRRFLESVQWVCSWSARKLQFYREGQMLDLDRLIRSFASRSIERPATTTAAPATTTTLAAFNYIVLLRLVGLKFAD